jgi:putative membrane protein
MKLSFTILATAAAVAFAAPLNAQTTSTTTQPDAMMKVDAPNFVQMAASAGAFEIKSSQLAEQKSQDPKIKQFARDMIKDHTQAAEDLKAAAKAENVQLPPEGQMVAKHQEMVKQLEAADSQQFDQLYMEMQNAGHDEAIALFNNFSKSGGQGQLQKFASQTLPTLQEHKQHLQQLTAAK